MEAPFQFAPLLLFGFMSSLLLIGIIFRARISFFQNFLIPSCLIGGALGFIAINFGLIKFNQTSIENFAYHFFNISFISVGLTKSNEEESVKIGQYLKGSVWMSMVQSISFSLQALIGGLLVIVLGILGMKLFATFGFLLPMGFEEGPGQALSFGKVWETVGFQHAATIGLTFAAVGFLFSFFVGVPIANWGIKRGYTTMTPKKLPVHFTKGIFPESSQNESAGELTTHSGNIETVAFHAALIGLVYVITYYFIKTLGIILPPDVAKMVWGFFFFFGMVIAFLVRLVMKMLKIDYMINSGIQRRITGTAVDFLIVATVMGIQLVIVLQYIVPISLMCIIGGIVTTYFVVYLGRRLPEYNIERSVAIYGAVTGTVSSGLLLLRIVDPEFRTPVALEIGIMNLFMVPIILGYGILVNAPIWWNWSVLVTVLVFTAAMVLSVGIIFSLKMSQAKRF